jgi:outer membrane lipoprotein SlyB
VSAQARRDTPGCGGTFDGMHLLRFVCLTALVFGLAACATKTPILYPNAHLQRVGEEQAALEVSECMGLANHYVGANRGKTVAKETAGSAAVGGAMGGASGAVYRGTSAGSAAGAGATAGAVRGFVRGMGRSNPDPVVQRFVDRCLYDLGYEVIGWGS